MSKRSVDKGDGGKNTAVQPREAKPKGASSTSLENKAKALSKAAASMSNDLYIYIALILTAIFSFYMRG
ncbi:MAG TPA: hypothetical protein PLK98_03940, partial [Methanothrix sp.]|nr:hypothetical protein [Methanothrix sp.]